MTASLLLAVVFMTALFVILKFFQKWNVHNLHGLFVNYFTASGISFFISYEHSIENFGLIKYFWPVSILIGLLFITVFFVTAKTAQSSGVAVATVASKMSMVIPILAGIYFYSEPVTAKKIAGTVLALISVYLVSVQEGGHTSWKKKLLLPFLLFVGAGFVDTGIKLAQHFYINEDNHSLFIGSLFFSAGLFGIVAAIAEKKKIERQSIFAGILLGTCNYFSLYFLLQCLAAPAADSGLVFTLINIGVVLLSIIASFFFFREKPSLKGMAGIAIAVIAIAVLL